MSPVSTSDLLYCSSIVVCYVLACFLEIGGVTWRCGYYMICALFVRYLQIGVLGPSLSRYSSFDIRLFFNDINLSVLTL